MMPNLLIIFTITGIVAAITISLGVFVRLTDLDQVESSV